MVKTQGSLSTGDAAVSLLSDLVGSGQTRLKQDRRPHETRDRYPPAHEAGRMTANRATLGSGPEGAETPSPRDARIDDRYLADTSMSPREEESYDE